MSFAGKLGMVVIAAMSLGIVSGCSPADQSAEDEEKEPHFVQGNDKFNAMDFTGAIEAFQESLEVNPRSAQAHYRLAQLFDTKEPDPAAAIYHYQEYLRLDPNADNSDLIRQRINTCKQQLAADVLPLPSAPATMKQIEDLTEQNRQLQQKVDDYADKLKQWNIYYNSQVASKTAVAPAPQNLATGAGPDDMTPQAQTQPNPAPNNADNRPKPPKARTHTVAAGETMAAIARKSGVSLAALEAANPGVNAKKLRVGQALNLPL
jgi:LysM repeat protein